MRQQPTEIEQRIHQLFPFRDLPGGDRIKLAQTVVRLQKNTDENLYANDFAGQIVYLLEGRVDVCRQYMHPQLIDEHSTDALRPLFNEHEEVETYVRVLTKSEFLLFNRELFNRLIEKEVIVDERHISRQMSLVESSIYNAIQKAVEVGQLELPSLPEVVLRIHKAVEDTNPDIEQMSRLILLDPGLSARLLKVANSSIQNGEQAVRTMRDVVNKLGLEVTRSLVLSFSVAQLYRTQQAVLKKQMKIYYSHSLEIASISYALARRIKDVDTEQMLLAGLIHDIGIIPIISYIDKTGLELHSEEEVKQLISSLRVAVGVMLVKAWNLPVELLNVVTHAEHWLRNSGGSLKVEDLVIMSQIYDRLKRKCYAELPNIENIPAFKKLFPGTVDTSFASEVLKQAAQEMAEMKTLLGV